MPARVRTKFPAEVKDHDGSMLKKTYGDLEHCISNAKAFKGWSPSLISIKKKSFREQAGKLEPSEAAKLKVNNFFDPDEVRKLWQTLKTTDVKKASEPVKQHWQQLESEHRS